MGCGGSKEKKKNQPEGVRISNAHLEKQKELEFKIVLLGEPSVGKSSIANRIFSGKFEENYKVTIGGAYLQKELVLRNKQKIKLHIWDTGGQEKFRAMAQLYYKDAIAAVLTYDVGNEKSLESLSYWVDELKNNVDKDKFVFSIAGNKSDLPNTERKLTYNQGKKFASDNNIEIFFETSAKKGTGIEDLFQSISLKAFNIRTKS